MVKYNIEGGLDFYAELYKSFDIEEGEEDENKCLITNQSLTDKYVKMECGHKFNYIPLFNDLVNHKTKFNFMEGTFSKLTTNEIRCPYCRTKQNYLLPYYEEFGLAKVNGVNFYDPNLKPTYPNGTYILHKCEYQYPNPIYDINTPETSTNSKYLKKTCHYHGTKINIYNKLKPSEPITYDDTKYYCYTHKKEMIKNYKLQQKEKKMLEKENEKNEKKKLKMLEKENKLLEKQKLKAKEKEEKNKAKLLKKKSTSTTTENVVLGPLNLESQTGCIQILKSGINKGNPCGYKIISENMCKRHFVLHNKDK